MAIEKREKKIGKHIYVVEQFGAKQGRQVWFQLVKLIGPTFATAIKSLDNDVEKAIEEAIRTFSATANVSDFNELCDAFASKTKIKREAQTSMGVQYIDVELAPIFDSHFAGNYSEMLGWLIFCVQTNYSDFLDAGAFSAIVDAARNP